MVDFMRMKRKFKNRIPFLVKWPLKALVYKPIGEGGNTRALKFIGLDALRADFTHGSLVYIFKSNADEVLPPRFGAEDAGNTLDLLQTGEGDYKFLNRELATDSQRLLFSIQDDEQSKYLYANQVELIANRFERERTWIERLMPFVVIIIAVGIAAGITLYLGTNVIKEFQSAVGTLSSVIQQNTHAVDAFGKAVGQVRPP